MKTALGALPTPEGPQLTLIPMDPARTAADGTLRREPSPSDSDDLALDSAEVDAAGEVPAPPPLPAAPEADLRPLSGAYEPLGRLGEGGAGIVHLARQLALDRAVAIKSVHPRATRSTARRSLLREARAAAALEHPNIVPVYDLVKGGGDQPGVVMRRIAGETWTTYLCSPAAVSRDFGARDLLGWHLGVLIQVCNAIHFAHSRGILHRDLKPDNVMIGAFGEVYVLDWGLATRVDERGPALLPLARDERRVVGTPRFMAPEMAAADGSKLSVRTDTYLICALLYTVLAGRGPHLGESIEATLAAIAHFQPRLPAGSPTRLVQLVERGMASDPALRPESADAVRRELQTYLEERGVESIFVEAQHQLAALKAAADRADTDRQALYRRFGAARFGFTQAARSGAHPEAEGGLRAALIAMARYELRQGDVRAADVLLAELEPPPEDLVGRRAALIAARAAEAADRARDKADQDPTIGQRTRIFVFSLFMVGWTVIPFISWFMHEGLSHGRMALTHGVNLVAVLALVGWARESLSKTGLNRRVAANLVVVSVALLVGDLGGWVLDVDPLTTVTFHHLVFAALCGAAVEGVDPRTGLLAALYLAVFAVGAWRPQLILPLGALANLVVALAAFALWAPAARGRLFKRLPEEVPRR